MTKQITAGTSAKALFLAANFISTTITAAASTTARITGIKLAAVRKLAISLTGKTTYWK